MSSGPAKHCTSTPPDILLTNYRMLDSLLVRPERKGLWEQNTPETLRFLVVDELHTFDGAQGTDLACLVRRLKDRLSVPKGSLCCIGTSATLGDQNDTKPIIDYARELFDEEFEPDCGGHGRPPGPLRVPRNGRGY